MQNLPFHPYVILFINTGILDRRLIALSNVNIGKMDLTNNDKIVYTLTMVGGTIIFVLRICLVAVITTLIWRLIEPKTKQARVLRAGLLVFGLLVTLALVRIIGV
jgi:hypothetical protein